jgi:hypothetical protein
MIQSLEDLLGQSSVNHEEQEILEATKNELPIFPVQPYRQ